MLEWLQKYSGALNVLASMALVAVTIVYVYITKCILKTAVSQSRQSLAPVLGIEVKGICIGPVFGPDRRNMSVEVALTNVGNAPAIEVLVDAELELRYSQIKNEKTIPARFEPSVVPFLRPNDTTDKCTISFGNTLITHFFDDARESHRLNLHRIETHATRESYKTSRLSIIVTYRNSVGQYFESRYDVEIGFWPLGGEMGIPGDNERAEVQQSYIPRPRFRAGPADERGLEARGSKRNAKRGLCGW